MGNEFDEILAKLYAENPDKPKNKLSQQSINAFRGGKILDRLNFEDIIRDILYGSPDHPDIKAYCFTEDVEDG